MRCCSTMVAAALLPSQGRRGTPAATSCSPAALTQQSRWVGPDRLAASVALTACKCVSFPAGSICALWNNSCHQPAMMSCRWSQQIVAEASEWLVNNTFACACMSPSAPQPGNRYGTCGRGSSSTRCVAMRAPRWAWLSAQQATTLPAQALMSRSWCGAPTLTGSWRGTRSPQQSITHRLANGSSSSSSSRQAQCKQQALQLEGLPASCKQLVVNRWAAVQGSCQQLLLRCSSRSKGSLFHWVQCLLLVQAAAEGGHCSASRRSSRELQPLQMLLLVPRQIRGLLAVLMLLCWKCRHQ